MTNPETRLAFDISLYTGDKREAQGRLVDDLSALVLELAETPEVSPYFLRETPDGKLVSPNGKDIKETLRWETRADILESKVTLKIRDWILSKEGSFIVVWISPPDKNSGYTRGEMVVSFKEEENGLAVVNNYGIRTDFLPDVYLFLANRLLCLSENKNKARITTGDEIKRTPVFIKPPEGENPVDFIADLIPLPNIWEKIKNGQAEARKEQARIDGRKIILYHNVMSRIRQATSRQELIAIGAFLELEMINFGWGLRRDSMCGPLNSDLVSFFFTHSHVSPEGAITIKNSEKGVFVRKCPYCNRDIYKVIRPGYKCVCGRIYPGVC